MPTKGHSPDNEIHVVFPENRLMEQLSALASVLLARQDEILRAWREAGERDSGRSPASSLSLAQFNDHIPHVLESFAARIQIWKGEDKPHDEGDQSDDLQSHGMQRWKQGYQLQELIQEWGHLQTIVADELERYEADHPDLEPGVMSIARRSWTRLCVAGVAESASQYWRLHQTESGGHVNDLEKALAALRNVERVRAEAWRTAAHDLRGSVTVVRGATSLLSEGAELSEPSRVEVSEMLKKSVSSLHEMLNDLLSLARLEAGHEKLEITRFDAAGLLRDFCMASQNTATDRGLYLKMDGPGTLPVEGDKNKVMRIVQNLLLNAVKYTERGGVSVTWGLDEGRDTHRWTFSVQDTGPGIDDNDSVPFAQEIHSATRAGDEAREASDDPDSEMEAAKTLTSESDDLTGSRQPGEGVGLTIVKRLCDLLDAGLELATKPGHGTTFRVILPCSYDREPE